MWQSNKRLSPYALSSMDEERGDDIISGKRAARMCDDDDDDNGSSEDDTRSRGQPPRWAFVTSASSTSSSSTGTSRMLAATIDIDTAAVLALQLCDATTGTTPFGLSLLRASAASAAARTLATAAGSREALLLLPEWLEVPSPLARGVMARLLRMLERQVGGSGGDLVSVLSSCNGSGPSGRAVADATLENVVAAWNNAPFASHGIVTMPNLPAKTPLSWAALAPLMMKNVGIGASATAISTTAEDSSSYGMMHDGHASAPRGGSPLFMTSSSSSLSSPFFQPTDTPISGSIKRLLGGESGSIDAARTGAIWSGCV
jgi:hypothetical protein